MKCLRPTEVHTTPDRLRRTALAGGLVFAAAPRFTLAQAPWPPASEPALATDLREEVVMVKEPGVFGAELETTLYRPPGDGPFPLIVVNHGKASGNPRFQTRSRYLVAARHLVRRGYAVVVPMRQGFSKSGGSYIGGGCNIESNGRVQAEDVVAALAFYSARPDIDARRIRLWLHEGKWRVAASDRAMLLLDRHHRVPLALQPLCHGRNGAEHVPGPRKSGRPVPLFRAGEERGRRSQACAS